MYAFSEDQVFHPGATQEMYLKVPRLPRNFALFPPILTTRVYKWSSVLLTQQRSTQIPIHSLIKDRRGCATSFPWSIDDRPEGAKGLANHLVSPKSVKVERDSSTQDERSIQCFTRQRNTARVGYQTKFETELSSKSNWVLTWTTPRFYTVDMAWNRPT